MNVYQNVLLSVSSISPNTRINFFQVLLLRVLFEYSLDVIYYMAGLFCTLLINKSVPFPFFGVKIINNTKILKTVWYELG